MNQNAANIAFTAPHYAASKAGQHVLEQGGTAIEAMVAAAASIAVVYPHMNGLGGDGFWLISEPGKKPIGIDASGVAANKANAEFYSTHDAIPYRGGKAAVTMAGAVSGWKKALEISAGWQPQIPLAELFAPAIGQARWGIEVTQSLSDASHKTYNALAKYSSFDQFLIKGKALNKGKIVKLPKLADTLQRLAEVGLDDFYHGKIAQQLSVDLQEAGSAIDLNDFSHCQAQIVEPLSVEISKGTVYNLGTPTQGIASLIILALFDRLQHKVTNDVDFIHLLVECTKQAFIVRNQNVTDYSRLPKDLTSFLDDQKLESMAANIDMQNALPWPHEAKQGDTVWMGACDSQGRMISYIQSLYWEFGSGIVSPTTGVVWNNRGTSFSLEKESLQYLQPRLKPFHTLNPAFAELKDGRRISYGTMGGEGQPQTQAALFTRYLYQNLPLTQAISAGRWLLGRTWGDESNNLKIEADIAQTVTQGLKNLGHDIAVVDACSELMGHAGAIVQFDDGKTIASTDPRSDGNAFSEKFSLI